jgi:hypothetical protein
VGAERRSARRTFFTPVFLGGYKKVVGRFVVSGDDVSQAINQFLMFR